MAIRRGWTPSDASARLVEEGLRRSEFAFIDYPGFGYRGDKHTSRRAPPAVWEVVSLVHSYQGNLTAVAKHLQWPEAKFQAAINYAEAFPEEVTAGPSTAA